ncbi:MAG: hypothetical protein Kow0098_19380 [Ignavibacteriaceae bacterium]
MIKNILFSLILLLTLGTTVIKSQELTRCGTMEVLDRLLKENPDLEQRMAAIEQVIQHKIIENKLNPETGGVIRTIPVVVHVVYNTSAQNISESQVQSQIRILNEDYRKLFGTNGWNNDPVGADTEIEFVLASTDPDGNPTNGITRTFTTKTSFTTNDDVKKSSRGGKDPWDTAHYLNIWVCNLSGGILGYAQFPGGPSSTDGVVCTYTAFGDEGTATPPFHLGRTASHEVGHYLNLYHTFQGGCTAPGDYCDDTPDVSSPNYGCPTGHISCGSVDMVENYMDYTDDACMNIFTICQSDRMNAILDGIRSSLVIPGGSGTAPVAVANGPYSGIEGNPIDFSSAGSYDPDGSIVSYLWNFGDGNTSTSANPTHTYLSAGTYPVTLTVTDNDGLFDSDVTTANISTIGGDPVVIYEEGFEFVGSEVPGVNWDAWDANGSSGSDYWGDQSTSSGARVHAGSWSIYCADNSNKTGQRYDNNMNSYAQKITGIDVNGYTDVEFSFWLWVKTRNSADYVSLEYQNNSGSWLEAARWYGSATTWSQKVFTLTGFSNFNFRFRFYSNASGIKEGAYIDDILCTGVPARSGNEQTIAENIVIKDNPGRQFISSSLTGLETKISDLFAAEDNYSDVEFEKDDLNNTISEANVFNYPNPFNPSTIISYQVPEVSFVSLKIYDILGNEIAELVHEQKSPGIYSVSFDASELAGGIYIYRLSANEHIVTKKMLLIK